jgi:hypothetical protein
MKKAILLIIFLMIGTFTYAQQILWSTSKDADAKSVSLDNVTSEVMKYYDLYDYYFDGSGYSKNNFIDEFNEGGALDWLKDVNTLTVIAAKTNIDGRGSAIYIMIIKPKAVDNIIFTNVWDYDAKHNYEFERDKFKRFFESLLE